MTTFEEILEFWFQELEPKQWWVKDTVLDEEIRDRFHQVYDSACSCELFEWRGSPKGRLAEIIVLDQFSRNMFRGLPEAFSQDALALALAQEAVSLGVDRLLSPQERSFLYMPYMHSESLAIHDVAVSLFRENGIESGLEYEIKHRDIIKRFGRYPHRNEALGRVSTPEELEFLKQPGSSF
jgi:uncharacterized protein (DUF924 family)